ncbi:MAG: hypothetical protein OXG15_09565 [Gammaproteobacteria bacterium]|nr:hypothetical protein [Gammaproteobacteria bacterium]
MSKLSVNPLVLGVGAFVVATAGSSVLAADMDAALDTSALDDSLLTIAGSHEGEGECGEKDEEGKCGEGQCGEDDGGEEEEGEEEEEEA